MFEEPQSNEGFCIVHTYTLELHVTIKISILILKTYHVQRYSCVWFGNQSTKVEMVIHFLPDPFGLNKNML